MSDLTKTIAKWGLLPLMLLTTSFSPKQDDKVKIHLQRQEAKEKQEEERIRNEAISKARENIKSDISNGLFTKFRSNFLNYFDGLDIIIQARIDSCEWNINNFKDNLKEQGDIPEMVKIWQENIKDAEAAKKYMEGIQKAFKEFRESFKKENAHVLIKKIRDAFESKEIPYGKWQLYDIEVKNFNNKILLNSLNNIKRAFDELWHKLGEGENADTEKLKINQAFEELENLFSEVSFNIIKKDSADEDSKLAQNVKSQTVKKVKFIYKDFDQDTFHSREAIKIPFVFWLNLHGHNKDHRYGIPVNDTSDIGHTGLMELLNRLLDGMPKDH